MTTAAAAAPPQQPQPPPGVAGIPFDTNSPMDFPPSIVVYGPPGSLKSTLLAHAYPNSWYVQTQGDILGLLARYASEHPGRFALPQQRTTIDEWSVVNTPAFQEIVTPPSGFGQPFKVGMTIRAINHIVQTFIQLCDAGQCPWDALIFDEWTTICARVYAELKADPWFRCRAKDPKKINIFAVMDAFKDWHQSILSLPRRTRRAVGFVCHAGNPRFFEDPADIAIYGRVKTPGGPLMPQGCGSEVMSICGQATMVIEFNTKTAKAPMGLAGLFSAPAAAPAALGVPKGPSMTDILTANGLGGVIAQDDPSVKLAEPAQVAAAPIIISADTPLVLKSQRTEDWFRKTRSTQIGEYELSFPDRTLAHWLDSNHYWRPRYNV